MFEKFAVILLNPSGIQYSFTKKSSSYLPYFNGLNKIDWYHFIS